MASMEDAAKALVRYWRSCVADGAIGKGCFSRTDICELVELSEADLAAGRIGQERAEALFAGRPASTERLSVRLWPILAARKVAHATPRSDGLPDCIAPIVTQAQLTRDGRLVAGRSVVARDLLDPLAEGAFSIGTVERHDRFLTVSPLPAGSGDGVAWTLYRDHCRQMLDDVADGWPRGDEDYAETKLGLLEVAEDASGTVRQILGLYDALIQHGPETPLLGN